MKLLPCPFCGKEAKAYNALPLFRSCYVTCPDVKNCGVSLPYTSATEEEAMRRWNKRTAQDK